MSQTSPPSLPFIDQSRAEPEPNLEPKPITFIRPADIYKRMEEEKEKERRASGSSRGRPSMDSVNKPFRKDSPSIERSDSPAVPSYGLVTPDQTADYAPETPVSAPLNPVSERASEYGMDGFAIRDPSMGRDLSPPMTHSATMDREIPESVSTEAPPRGCRLQEQDSEGASFLPAVHRVSGFGMDMFDSGSQGSRDAPPTDTMLTANPADQQTLPRQPSPGYRSAVERAFEGETGSNLADSSQSSQGDVSRSNTDSTGAISPIMSRVPSGATAARRMQESQSTFEAPPAIQEESQETGSPRPESTSTLQGPPGTHSREISESYRRDLNPPDFDNSPAHKLSLETQDRPPEGSEAQVELITPSSHYTDSPRSPTSATAHDAYSYPEAGYSDAGGPDEHLAAHYTAGPATPRQQEYSTLQAQTEHDEDAGPIEDNYVHVEPESTTHEVGEVQRGIDDSRFGSEHHNDILSVPQDRPSIPGGWVSYASSVPTEYAETERGATSAMAEEGTTAKDQEEHPDLSPNTPTQVAQSHNEAKQPSDHLAAVAAAGTALGVSLVAATGITYMHGRDHEVTDSGMLTPTQENLGAMSKGSPLAPTPPPKDTPQAMTSEPAEGYFPQTGPLRPGASQLQSDDDPDRNIAARQVSQMSVESSPEDTESDRLRKDIVRHLSPQEPSAGAVAGDAFSSEHLAPQVTGPADATRESTVIPREYDHYWASTDPHGISTQPMHEPDSANMSSWEPGATLPQFQTASTAESSVDNSALGGEQSREELAYEDHGHRLEDTPASATGGRPGYIKRFSWENEDEYAPSVDIHSPPTASVEPAANAPEAALPSPPTGDQPRMLTTVSPLPNVHSEHPASDAFEMPGSGRQSEEPAMPPVQDRTSWGAAAGAGAMQQNIPGFKDILAVKRPDQRIEMYERTRGQFASMDTGIDTWLAEMLRKDPEHAQPPPAHQRAPVISTGLADSVRNKFSPAIGRIGKSNATSSSPTNQQQQPYYQQYLDSAQAAQPNPTSSPTASPINNPIKGRQPSQQGSKGIFGNKASSGAKAFFSKSKNKLKGGGSDKVD